MLALARGEGQSIIIDGTIEVKIVKWSRSSVRIAIQAPREVTVDRDEIWRKMNPGALTPLERAEKQRNERMLQQAAGMPLVNFENCPPAVQGAVKAAVGDGTLLTIAKKMMDGKTVFVAHAKVGEQARTWTIADDGKMLGIE